MLGGEGNARGWKENGRSKAKRTSGAKGVGARVKFIILKIVTESKSSWPEILLKDSFYVSSRYHDAQLRFSLITF